MRGFLVALVGLGMSSVSSMAVSVTAGAFGTFHSGVDASFDPFSSPPGLATTDSHAARQSWLGAFSGSSTVTTQNFDSGFVYGSSVAPRNAPTSQTVNGYTYSTSFFTADQTGIFRGASGDALDLDPVGIGPDSTRGFNVEEGQYAGANRGYFQVKPNSTSGNDGGLKVDFGSNGVLSFGFYLTGREATKQQVNLVIEYANSNIDTLTPTSAGNLGVGGLGFIGYVGDGNEIANFKLEEVFSGAGEDIFAIDGLETLTVVPEPGTWAVLSSIGLFGFAAVRRYRNS